LSRPAFSPTKKQIEHAQTLAEKGCNEEEIAKGIGVSYSTLRKHKEQFLVCIKKGREDGADRNLTDVKNSLLKLCLGFEYTETHVKKDNGVIIEEKKITKYYPPHATSIIFYLVNKSGGEFRSINQPNITLGENVDEHFKRIVEAIERTDTIQ